VVPRRCAIQIHDFTLFYFTSILIRYRSHKLLTLNPTMESPVPHVKKPRKRASAWGTLVDADQPPLLWCFARQREYVSNLTKQTLMHMHIWPEGLLYDAERNLLATAKSFTLMSVYSPSRLRFYLLTVITTFYQPYCLIFWFILVIFLPRDATHSADYAVARCLSICPSVCLSVTCWYCVKTPKNISYFFTDG